jgi:hypothetical protein
MPSVDQARRLALALPEAMEKDHHGRPSFRVGGRIFATLWDQDHMNVMVDEPGILTAVQEGDTNAVANFEFERSFARPASRNRP